MNRKKWAFVIVSALAVLLLLLLLLFLFERIQNEMKPFSKQYEGIKWQDGVTTQDMSIVISVEGCKNQKGEFSGNITVTSGADVLLSYPDCRVIPMEHFWAIYNTVPESGEEDLFLPMVQDIMLTDKAWSAITIVEKVLDPISGGAHWNAGSCLYSAPATSIDEAIALTERLIGN